ncbi:hypothetical protein DYD21_08115 [Rhodohalobacter sp. SW132]|uniref:hypothetical protein n=1 Tax=Rhodohalobacter sp. SW132 TaxID=2293433 RepID=UPI000E257BB7|nr:hypothetical protein [Rhodohalobacter sp. SW132]REL37737.1 hypothetical protein DYD21_08115 [Rhodohalobacter sp. SW132]
MQNRNFQIFIAKFSLLFVVTYSVIAVPFLYIQDLLPESQRVALDLYEPFRPLNLMTILTQFLRGILIALVIHPFKNTILNYSGGRLILFGALWGVALFGSVEPQPGSIEGIIYTEITFIEHSIVMLAVAIQMTVFIWLFFKWILRSGENRVSDVPEYRSYIQHVNIRGYTYRFTLVHLITYWAIGVLFYQFAGYEEALESMEIFELWRPLETVSTVLLVLFGQLFRGTLLALLLYPFYQTYMRKKHGWLYLFLLLFGLTALGSPIFIPEFLVFEGSLAEFFEGFLIGIPEIFSQMMVFSAMFFYWERKKQD